MRDFHSIIKEQTSNCFDMVMMQRDGENCRYYMPWRPQTICIDGKVIDTGKSYDENGFVVSADGMRMISIMKNIRAHEFTSSSAAWASAFGVSEDLVKSCLGLSSEEFYKRISEVAANE